jgi:hypothetical protein
MSSSIVRHSGGISWLEPGGMRRASHAVVDQGRVWFIDPFEDADALAAAAELGQAAAVIQLLDRHRRDGEAIARRLGVPLLQMPALVSDSPFEVVEVISLSRWKEIALWWPTKKTLIVSEAVGTAPLFALGRAAGVHPLLRALPPRQALGRYMPDVLLVGHGPPVVSDAATALTEALRNARRDIPKFVLSVPRALRDR